MSPSPSSILFAAASALAAVGMAACSKPATTTVAAPAASGASGQVNDVDVTEHVKTALLQTGSLKGLDITVVTLKGDVRLTGVVDTQAQIDEALRIARTAEGAHSIHDELTLKK